MPVLVHREFKEQLAHRGKLVAKDYKGYKDNWDHKDYRDCKVFKV
jgi:hypothetical protein